jgi:polyphosphate glucokinase
MEAAVTLPKLADLPAESLPPAAEPKPSKILVADIGGTKMKILASGQIEPRKVSSGRKLTPGRMVEAVTKLAGDWEYEAVSLGYPGLVGSHGPRSEPGNLGPGWVGFDFASAFGCSVRIINDAAMQALGSYEGGRMLFLGLGTGLGSALIAENTIIPLELGEVPYKGGSNLGAALGKSGLRRLGKEAWIEAVKEVVATFGAAFVADYVVLGGGNAKKLKGLLPGVRLGHNLTTFRGGLRLWNIEYATTLSAEGEQPAVYRPPADWRMV